MMARHGVEPIRRAALVKAAIEEIGAAGSLDVTVAQIARRAGVSAALAHHYFGSKEQLFLAAMRGILADFGSAVRGALALAETPADRVRAIIRASFEGGNFRREVIAAWLNFYLLAESHPGAHRLLRIYQRRMRANLRHALRPLVGLEAEEGAELLAALIDGFYLREALADRRPSPQAAVHIVEAAFARLLPMHRENGT